MRCQRQKLARTWWTALGIGLALGASASGATPWVGIEVAAEQGGPPGNMQEWARLLDDLGVDQVRIRGIRASDKPRLESQGEGESTRYSLVGVLTRRDELVLPNGKFTLGDRGKLQEYLRSLGDQPGIGPERGRFDLTSAEFEALYAALTPSVGETFQGLSGGEALDLIAKQFEMAIVLDVGDRKALDQSGPLRADLSKFSLGTALAYVARIADRAVAIERPRSANALPIFHLVPLDADLEAWPVGWRPQKVSKVLAPQIYRITTIEIKGYTLAQTLTALAPHMGLPLILDQRQLAKLGIEPEKIQVKVARKKNSVKKALDLALSQARLGAELRVDEGGRPFFWITQFGKESRRAE